MCKLCIPALTYMRTFSVIWPHRYPFDEAIINNRIPAWYLYLWCSPWRDKVSMLTHTYPHCKPLVKTKVTICNHQADSPLYVWPDVWPGDLQVWKTYGHTWHQISLLRPGVIKQHKPIYGKFVCYDAISQWDKWNSLKLKGCLVIFERATLQR